jgi:glutathione peroxidase
MKAIIVAALITIGHLFTVSIYSHQYTDLSGNTVSMSQYQGKKMLLVNIATEDEKAATQIPQLEQLYQQYKDSLVVIGFSSADFGGEPRTDNEIKLLMQNTYHTLFPISARVGIKDSTANTHPLFKWLQHKSENGTMDIKLSRNFQKILVDKDGSVIGFFGSAIEPMSAMIQNAIKNN